MAVTISNPAARRLIKLEFMLFDIYSAPLTDRLVARPNRRERSKRQNVSLSEEVSLETSMCRQTLSSW